MTVDAALLTVSQFRCVLWPMALDNTLMVSRRLVPVGCRARLHSWHPGQEQIWRACLLALQAHVG